MCCCGNWSGIQYHRLNLCGTGVAGAGGIKLERNVITTSVVRELAELSATVGLGDWTFPATKMHTYYSFDFPPNRKPCWTKHVLPRYDLIRFLEQIWRLTQKPE